LDVLIVGNGGISKGFQEVFEAQGQSFDLYHRGIGDLYELPEKVKKRYDLLIYAVGDIVWKRIKDITVEDIEKVFKPNAFGFFILAKTLPQIMNEKGKVIVIGARLDRITSSFLSLYASSKAALKTFIEVCRREIRTVSFYLIEPEEIDTPLWKKVPIKPGNPKNPKDFAQDILALVEFPLPK
jgi:short-subunit dehydrogenase